MSDPVSNRPTQAEEAAASARRADQVRDKKTESLAAAQGAQGKKVQGQTKELKSSFDEMLKNLSEGPAAVVPQEAKFDSRLKEIQRDQDHHSSDRDRDEDKKPKEKSDSGKKTKDTSETGRERVVGKHQSGQGQQDSGKGGGEEKGGQGGRGFQQRSQAQIAQNQSQAEELRKMQQATAAPAPMPMQDVQQPNPMEAVQAPRELPKALLEQIINHVRVGMDKKQNKMMEIEFHDQIFNGLMFRITSHGKEVSLEFIAPNRSVKDCFMEEREKIALALGDKGIDCREIRVTLR